MFPVHPPSILCGVLVAVGFILAHFKLEDDAPCAAQFPISIITLQQLFG
jgi:hypothetical protein